jgi:hypothetical protein
MPGGVRWEPTKEPFSYAKLCFYYIPGLLVFVGIALLVASAFGTLPWLGQIGSWLPSSVPLRIAIGAALIVGYYFFCLKMVWRLLPADVRARIPYDRQEALESKGDIKSFWDLRKLLLPTRN